MRFILICSLLLAASLGQAMSANKVMFESLDNGRYRISIAYTLPPLKEFRAATVEFKTLKEAEVVYWRLVKGADFYLEDSGKIRFESPKTQAAPW